MLDVAKWIVSNLPFDRLYFYGIDRPIHVSYSERPVSQITVMRKSPSGKLVPRTLDSPTFLEFDKSSL
jgi:hypothetical protein